MVEIPLYNSICRTYNTTRKADKFILGRISSLLRIDKAGKYIDMGCGTGNYTIGLENIGGEFTGIDPARRMLEVAKQNGCSIEWRIGNAENIPFNDKYFDGGLATLTIHHWENIGTSFLEINRVLKLNGRFVLFTSLPKQMKGYWLNHYFPEMMVDSIKKMPSLEIIEIAVNKAGFKLIDLENYDIQPSLEDKFLYSGKLEAEMYLDDNFRNGISSFSSNKYKLEIEDGLRKLKSDIDSGEIAAIQEKFRNDTGDYIFIVYAKVSDNQ